jgi:hypothetical protein
MGIAVPAMDGLSRAVSMGPLPIGDVFAAEMGALRAVAFVREECPLGSTNARSESGQKNLGLMGHPIRLDRGPANPIRR